MFKFSSQITAANLISLLLIPFNKIIIARYLSLESVTYFEIANRIVFLGRSFYDRSIKAIFPEISKLTVLNHANKHREIVKYGVKIVLKYGAFFIFILFIFAPLLLKLWLQNSYHPDIALALRIILCGFIFNLFSIPHYYYFMGIGKADICFYTQAIQALLNFSIVLTLVLIGVLNFNSIMAIYSFSIFTSSIFLILIYFNINKGK